MSDDVLFHALDERCLLMSCGAAGQVEYLKGDLDLIYCKHHGDKQEMDLIMVHGFKLGRDNRPNLNPNKLVGSEN